MDADLQSLLAKTLDTSSTNGNNVLNPVLLSVIIAEQVRRMPRLRSVLPREKFTGKTYLWDIESAPGDAITAADGATLSLVDGVWSQGNVEMSYIYFATQITNPAVIAAQELINLVEDRTRKATQAIVRQEGNIIFNGDPIGGNKTGGLFSALSAAPRFINGGTAGQSLQPSLLDFMVSQMQTDGYDPGEMIFCMSPKMLTAVKAFAFNHYRQQDLGSAKYGFPFDVQAAWNGVGIVADPYAAKNVSVSNETMSGSGTTYTFANPNVVLHSTPNGTDGAGNAETAPVLKVSGTTVTNYTLSQNASGGTTATFASAPGSAPVASYVYKQENIYLLSLNKADIVIPESLACQVDSNLFAPVTQDIIPLRVKQYSSLVVRNNYAHVLASNVLAPNSTVGF